MPKNEQLPWSGRAAFSSWSLAILALLPMCSSAASDTGPKLYAECSEKTPCSEGDCAYDPVRHRYRCLPECIANLDCATGPEGETKCYSRHCIPLCTGHPLSDGTACVDGAVRECEEVRTIACDQCSFACSSETYCGSDARCTAKLSGLGACSSDEQCLSNVCRNGLCDLNLNTPCVAGDQCQCVFGFCTQPCATHFGDSAGGCPQGFACSDGFHPVANVDDYTGNGWCHRECQRDAAVCQPGQSCELPPDYFSVTEIRICAWH